MRKRRPREFFQQLEVIDAGAKGKAIAKAPDGRTIFIRNAVPGDIVDVQTTKKRKSYFEAEATYFHHLSDRRTKPRCEHFGICGGCKWQHMAYEHQLYYKEQEVLNNLRRIGHLQITDTEPIIGSAATYEYRNKLEFSFSDSRWLSKEEIEGEQLVEDRNALGFHIPGMWDKILDIRECHLQKAPSNEIRQEIRAFSLEHGMEFYSPRNKKGFLRNLMIRTTSTGDLMVLLQFFQDRPDQRIKLLEHIGNRFPQITSLLYVINNKANDTIYDLEVSCFKGQPYIFEEMEGLRFRIGAKSFYQTNSDQAYVLYKIVREFAAPQGGETVYDLYTGTGTIALFLARHVSRVIGIDSVPEAVESAKFNASNNRIDNALFFTGDMKVIFDDEFIGHNGVPDIIIADPPRDGMHKNVVRQILNIGSPKIVYVSCNSATQARDLALMNDTYEIRRIQPVDMFPQTHHVENVVLLEKRIP